MGFGSVDSGGENDSLISKSTLSERAVKFSTTADSDEEGGIPATTQGGYDDSDFDWCLVMNSDRQEAIQSTIRTFEDANLIMCTAVERREKKEVFVRVTAADDALEAAAEIMGLKLKLKEYSQWREDLDSDRARFEVLERQEFFQDEDGRIPFSSAERQQIVSFIVKYVANFDMRQEKAKGVLKHFYPIHDTEELAALEKKALKSVFRQPLEDYRLYFGEKFAMYYAFLDYYVLWLTIPAVMGTVLFCYQAYRRKVDTIYLLPYSFFIMGWATVYLIMWRRKATMLQVQWDIDDVGELSEQPRDEFLRRAKIKVSPITDLPEAHYSSAKRHFFMYSMSYPVITTLVLASLAAILSLLVMKLFTKGAATTLSASILNAVVIMILNSVYRRVAVFLTKLETHRTDADYENHLIAKLFVLQFVNTYAALFYTAFIKGRFAVFGKLEKCRGSEMFLRNLDNTCMVDVEIQLASLFFSMIFFSNVTEILMPFLKKAIKQCALPFVKKNNVHPVVEQGKRPTIDEDAPATFMDYNEMVVQFGFLAMFSSSFALAPLAALVNNIIEIRVDSLKLFRSYQRPPHAVARDIGLWYSCMDTLVWAGIVTNVFMLGFTLNRPVEILNVTTMYWRLGVVLIIEHVMVVGRIFLKKIIPRQSKRVKHIRLRRAYITLLRRDKTAGVRHEVLTGAHRKYSQVGSEMDEDTQRMLNNMNRMSRLVGTVRSFSIAKMSSIGPKLKQSLSTNAMAPDMEAAREGGYESPPDEPLKFGEKTGKKKPRRKEGT